MSSPILSYSRDFFEEQVKPLLLREFPEETAQTAFGIWGYGSEVLGLDDEFSRDHHWGIRINAVMPDALHRNRRDAMTAAVEARLPDSFRGIELEVGKTPGKGLSLDNREAFLERTIGLLHAPTTEAEWLSIPEEDILHIVGGEVWYDPSAVFTRIREVFQGYYPEPVRRRRIAHWCRYYSGMGAYALKRAILRDNDLYSVTTFARAIKLGVQLAFLLDRVYFPYDKWLWHYFERLPRMADRMGALVAEAVKLETPWARKLELLDAISDVLDRVMVEDGLLQPHAPLKGSPTSGYRLMESAYAEILRGLPAEIRTLVPVWDQIPFERFHSGYVAGLDEATWRGLLNLTPREEGA